MWNTIRTLAAVMILGMAAGCGPDQGTTRDPAIDGTAPGTTPGTAPGMTPGAAPGTVPGQDPATAPGMMPGDTMHMDTVPRTGAPGAPGTTGG
jgi:hypothetical protein